MKNNVNLVLSADKDFVINAINDLADGANIFLFFKNEYENNGDIKTSIFDAIEELEKKNLHFINCIIFPLLTKENFCDNVMYILWFTNNIKKYVVYKDTIREKSIWKDVEWGKREKNYNKKGKDPGNVWIPTEDDGKGRITGHIILTFDQIVERIVKFASKKNDEILFNLNKEFSFENRNNVNVLSSKKLMLEATEYKINYLEENNDKKELNSSVFFESSEKMQHVNDLSLSCMVTSPPYWDIKNYYKEGQIGQESYSDYQKRITSVWKETASKIKNTGSVWININTIFKNKKMVPIPTDIIKNCKKLGLHFKACIIWHKSSAIPTHSLNLCDHFEYVLVFTKTDKFYLNKKAIDHINDYENEGMNNGSFWNINRKAGIIGKNYIHPAVFPLELIERIIKFSTTEGDIVLDPFLGSGTSLIAALNSNRSFIGYEYYEGFKDLIAYRIANECNEKELTKYYLRNATIEHKIFRNEN